MQEFISIGEVVEAHLRTIRSIVGMERWIRYAKLVNRRILIVNLLRGLLDVLLICYLLWRLTHKRL